MTLTGRQLELVQATFHRGADHASEVLGRWIGRPAHITFDAIEQLPLDEAMGVLGPADDPICCCTAEMNGLLTGHLVLAFDDASGLILADLLLGQERGTATEWNDLETSAALETCNIVCCEYLNALVQILSHEPGEPDELLPSPPRFARDFAASLLQFALMDQLVRSDEVLLARTQFNIDGAPVDWTLLFVPNAGIDVEAPRGFIVTVVRDTAPSIKMGELAVAMGDGVLRTLLGSCIGLALYDRQRKVGGLAHVVLPQSRGNDESPGKFMDTAIPALVEEMQALAGGPLRPEARIAGGANMFATSVTNTVGRQNIEACERLLGELGLPLVGRHCGGEKGRRMMLCAGTGVVTIEVVGAEPIEI